MDQKLVAKIDKAVEKQKSKPVIKMLKKADKETLVKILEAFGKIGDEDSRNNLSHFFDNEDNDIRIAACKAALTINSEYMRTRVRHQLAMEKDAAVKAEIQRIFNEAK